MANVISGLDAAWRFPGLAGLRNFKSQGGKVIAGYLSYDPSKDWTAARLKLVHGVGLGALMNFESYANRALEGRAAGLADGEHSWDEIARLIRAVGYAPKSHLHIYASADFDARPAQYPAIDAYLTAFGQGLLARHANADQAVYGSYTLVVHTATVGTSKAEWQTYAWSGGKFYTGAEYYQWSNSHNAFGAAVDYDQAINLEHLGAWWPPGHPLDVPVVPAPITTTPTPPVRQRRRTMLVYRIDPATVPKGVTASGWFTFNGSDVRHVDSPQGATNNGSALLHALGQAEVATVTYQQHADWKAGK